MTRVAGVPEELRAAASILSACGPELELAASLLASTALPEMPPGVAAGVSDTLQAATRTLREAARTATTEGTDLRRRGLWLAVADAGLAAYGATAPWKAFAEAPLTVMDLAARRRAFQMLEAWGRYEKVVVPIVDEYGPDSTPATVIQQLFRARRGLSEDAYRAIVAHEGDLDAYESGGGIPLAALRELAGKMLGPVGIVAGAVQVFLPEHKGLTGVGDRIAGGAGFLGSVGATALSYEGLAATAAVIPGVDLIVGGLLIGAAGWDMWTHRKEIAKAVVSVGRYVEHHPAMLAGPAGVAAQEVWDHRRQIAHVAVSAADWGVHRVEDAAKPAVSAYHDVTHFLGL